MISSHQAADGQEVHDPYCFGWNTVSDGLEHVQSEPSVLPQHRFFAEFLLAECEQGLPRPENTISSVVYSPVFSSAQLSLLERNASVT